MNGLPDRFGSSVAMNYVATAVSMAIGLVLTPLLLHNLGKDAFAVWVLAGATSSYLELFELGFGVATTKLVAEDAGRDTPSLLKTVNSSLAVLSLLGVAAIVVGLLVSALAPFIFQIPDGLRGEAFVVFALLTVTIGISIPGDVFGGVLAGHQRYDLLSISNLLLAAGGGGAAILVVLAGGGVVAVVMATSIVSVSMHGIRWFFVRQIVPGMRLGRSLVERRRMRAAASLSGWFFVRDIASTIIFRIDLVVIAMILGPKQTAVYAVGLKLAQLSEKMIIPLSQVFLPHASALGKTGDTAGLSSLLVDGTRAAMLPGVPATLVLAVLARDAIPAWVGPGSSEAVEVLIILAVALGLRSVTTTAWQVLAGTGKGKLSAGIATAEAIANLAISVILTFALGIVGPAIGTLIGVLLIRVPLATLISCRTAHLPLSTYFVQAIRPHLLPIAAAASTLFVARPHASPSLIPLFGIAMLGSAAYLVIYWMTATTYEERERVITTLGSVIRDRSGKGFS